MGYAAVFTEVYRVCYPTAALCTLPRLSGYLHAPLRTYTGLPGTRVRQGRGGRCGSPVLRLALGPVNITVNEEGCKSL